MKTITIAGTEIKLFDNKIGLYHSGGADSSLLLYVLMKYTTDNIHIFTCASKEKNYASAKVSNRVIEKCIELTGNNNIMHHTHYVDSQNDEVLFSPQKYYVAAGELDILYTGVTANPPVEISNTFNEESTENIERDPSVERSVFIHEYNIYTPFTNINKQVIGKMYDELGLTTTLFPLTRSCEDRSLSDGHCGECWWCQERQWGFGKLS
jgi:7-cyano-7-deazaguanine synthase in queuosine biosynthesis